MSFGYKDNFHFRPIRNEDEKKVRNIIFSILDDYGLKLDIEGVDHDLFEITKHYSRGLFGVIEEMEKGEIVGSFALYPMNNTEYELRKMFLLKEYRGKGLGKWVMDFCEVFAKREGFTSISLETASVLKEAIGLYVKKGYKHVSDDNHTERCDVLMRKYL